MENNWIIQKDDAEIYQKGDKYIIFVWGYSTGSDAGIHNKYNTDVLCCVWEGEKCKPEELPKISDERWKEYTGFDIEEDEESGYDWDDYAEKVDQILNEI